MKPPAFQFYVDDFLGGTMHFTDAEVGLYMRLLCLQWNTGSIPDDDAELSSYGKGGTPLARVKSKFEKGTDGRLRNARLERVRQKQAEWRLKSSEGGKKSANKRWGDKGGYKMVKRPLQPKHKQVPEPNCNTPVSVLRTPVSDLQPPKEDSASPPSSEHVAFIDGWVQNFKAQFGFEYSVDGGRDGKAVRELLRLGVLRIDLLEIAKKAWLRASQPPKAFNCEQASTIHGFKNYFNQIQVELKNGNTHQKPNQRLVGIARSGIDYGEAAKRKLERQVAQAANQPSQAGGNGA